MKNYTFINDLVEYPWITTYLLIVLSLYSPYRGHRQNRAKTATEYAVEDNTNIEKGENHMLGYDFLQSSPEEKLIIILVLLGALAVVGVATLVSNIKKKT